MWVTVRVAPSCKANEQYFISSQIPFTLRVSDLSDSSQCTAAVQQRTSQKTDLWVFWVFHCSASGSFVFHVVNIVLTLKQLEQNLPSPTKEYVYHRYLAEGGCRREGVWRGILNLNTSLDLWLRSLCVTRQILRLWPKRSSWSHIVWINSGHRARCWGSAMPLVAYPSVQSISTFKMNWWLE